MQGRTREASPVVHSPFHSAPGRRGGTPSDVKTSEKHSPSTPPIIVKAGNHHKLLGLTRNETSNLKMSANPGNGPAGTLFSLPTQHFSQPFIETYLTFCIISSYGNVTGQNKKKKKKEKSVSYYHSSQDHSTSLLFIPGCIVAVFSCCSCLWSSLS